MYINRTVIARLLETKPSNIRKIRQVQETIHVQLWNYKEPVIVTIEQYKGYFEQLRKHPRKLNAGDTNREDPANVTVQQYKEYLKEQQEQPQNLNMGGARGVGTILMIIGAIVAIHGYTMDTTVSSDFGRIHNIGLVAQQNNQIQLGGLGFIAGVVLYCLDKTSNS